MSESTCDPQELVSAGSCFACQEQDQRDGMIITLLCRIASALGDMTSCDPQTLINGGACFACLTKAQRDGVIIQLLCDISAATGGGGGGATTPACGSGSPEGIVDGGCGRTYVDITGFAVYHKTTGSGILTGWI
jgi:hypothetical protein